MEIYEVHFVNTAMKRIEATGMRYEDGLGCWTFNRGRTIIAYAVGRNVTYIEWRGEVEAEGWRRRARE